MNKIHNFLIIGGDNRYLEVIENLAYTNSNIYLDGYEQLEFAKTNIFHVDIKEEDLSHIDAVLLPVAGLRKNGEAEAVFSSKEIRITSSIINQIPAECKIFSGIANPELAKLANSCNREITELFKKDDVAISNSIPTAEGALKVAIEQTDHTIHGSSVLVLGLGRVGFSVAKLFQAAGAKVSVGIRKTSDSARAELMGFQPINMNELAEKVSELDICINTVPKLIVTREILLSMPVSALVIDLASKPGGTDFGFAKELGIKAVHALGLPGKTAPKTAGKIISDTLIKLYEL